MAPLHCPPECQEKLKGVQEDLEKVEGHVQRLYGISLPSWCRSVVLSLLGLLFLLYGGLWVYLSGSYTTKEEVREIKGELRSDIRAINDKLDLILTKVKREDR
jgi:hypothetical protein